VREKPRNTTENNYKTYKKIVSTNLPDRGLGDLDDNIFFLALFYAYVTICIAVLLDLRFGTLFPRRIMLMPRALQQALSTIVLRRRNIDTSSVDVMLGPEA
jgi:hypothetical protein